MSRSRAPDFALPPPLGPPAIPPERDACLPSPHPSRSGERIDPRLPTPRFQPMEKGQTSLLGSTGGAAALSPILFHNEVAGAPGLQIRDESCVGCVAQGDERRIGIVGHAVLAGGHGTWRKLLGAQPLRRSPLGQPRMVVGTQLLRQAWNQKASETDPEREPRAGRGLRAK